METFSEYNMFDFVMGDNMFDLENYISFVIDFCTMWDWPIKDLTYATRTLLEKK